MAEWSSLVGYPWATWCDCPCVSQGLLCTRHSHMTWCVDWIPNASLDSWDLHSIVITVILVELHYQKVLFWETGGNDAYNDFLLVQLGCLRWERLKSCLSARVYYQLALLVPSPKLPERTNPSSVPFKAPAWRPGYKTSCHTVDGYLVPHRLMESRVQNA